MSEGESVTREAGGAPAAPPPKAPPAAAQPAPPARALPTAGDVAAWIGGAEVPLVGALFAGLNVAKFDTLVAQVRKEELLPQHWQVIAKHGVEDEAAFDRLSEVERLRRRYSDPSLARPRLEGLRAAWRELRGKRPALWTVPDLMAAMRRIIDKKLVVDLYDLLAATRDIWGDLTLPHGREQLDMLWNCLELIRAKTKK